MDSTDAALPTINLEFNQDTRILMTYDKKREAWFKAKDVTDILQLDDHRQAIRNHIDPQHCRKVSEGLQHLTDRFHPDTIFINATGLIFLMVNMQKRIAKPFLNWILNTVLPSTTEYKLLQHASENRHLSDQLLQQETEISHLSDQLLESRRLTPLKPNNTEKWNNFLVLRKNCNESPCMRSQCYHEFEYYAVREQGRSLRTTLKKLSRRYPRLQIIVSIEPGSGGVDFFNVLKERLEITHKYNNFNTNLQEINLIKIIHELSSDGAHKQKDTNQFQVLEVTACPT